MICNCLMPELGSGRERNMKGSNVIDMLEHTAHTSVDLSWP